MADALTPDGIRTRQFDVVLRGYDRSQVEAFLAEIAARLDELERSIGDLDAVDPSLGIDDREALARELHLIGGEVGEILEAARSAAERMRSRAAADAEAWTTDARQHADEVLSTAREQSHAARASAWKEGTALLASAAAEVAAMLDAAKEETLFVRAEAEREALRHTGDAKRDREETIRAARAEAEAIIEGARAESDAVLTAAHQQAEQAQERARALEDRRAELLAELEAARASISDMENEIESKRQELEAPAPAEEGPEVDRSHHEQDSGSVRIVAPSAVVPLSPVDAEELVAEVTALRAAPPPPAPPSTPPAQEVPAADDDERLPPDGTSGVDAVTEPAPKPVTEQVAEVPPQPPSDRRLSEPIDAVTETGATSADDVEPPSSSPAPTATASTAIMPTTAPSDDAADEVEADDGADAGPDAPPETEAVPEGGDTIGSLFAQLRSGPPSTPDTPDAEVDGSVDEDAGPATVTERSSVSQHLSPAVPPDDQAADADEVVAEAASDASVEARSESRPPDDAEARIVTARNTALRTVKRSLVELQNEALEHLRTDGAWMPSEEFTDRFREPFAELTATLSGVGDDAAGSAFGADLFDAVTSAIDHARSAGAGEREVAAAASKVFRMWRSDEAERRIIDAATVVSV